MKELFTELSDRVLRFDGVSVVSPGDVEKFFLRGIQPSKLRVTEVTPDLSEFNQRLPDEAIREVSDEEVQFDLSWILPEKYLKLDVVEHVLAAFEARLPGLKYSPGMIDTAVARVATELGEFERRDLHDLLRVIIYVLDRFKAEKQVWGVGRGSSCASYILFILGLHVVDAVKFNVDMHEFFH